MKIPCSSSQAPDPRREAAESCRRTTQTCQNEQAAEDVLEFCGLDRRAAMLDEVVKVVCEEFDLGRAVQIFDGYWGQVDADNLVRIGRGIWDV